MMDLDGHIQVLQPDFPGISIRNRAHKQLRLPNFFAGYNAPMESGARYAQNGMVSYDRDPQTLGNDTRGSVIALASRAPFNLELIEADGDWNLAAIRQIIENRTPEGAAQALARYLGAKGEPIGHDYMRFAGQRSSYYAYNGYEDLSYCGYSGYGYASLGGGYYRADAYSRIAQLRAVGLQPFIAGYDGCGVPIVVVAPFNQGTRFPIPVTPRPHGDTTVFPKVAFPARVSATSSSYRGHDPGRNLSLFAACRAPAGARRHDHRTAGPSERSRASFSTSTARNPESPRFRKGDGFQSSARVPPSRQQWVRGRSSGPTRW